MSSVSERLLLSFSETTAFSALLAEKCPEDIDADFTCPGLLLGRTFADSTAVTSELKVDVELLAMDDAEAARLGSKGAAVATTFANDEDVVGFE